MKTNVICKKFNSTGELSKYLEGQQVTNTFNSVADEGSYSTSSYYASWALTNTYMEADNLLLYGDRELQKKIEDAGVKETRTKLEHYANRRKVFSSVVGFAANVPAYLSGTPNSMINVRQVRTKQKVLTFMYNTSVRGSVSAERIVRATAQLVSAVLLIESSGVRVNVYAGEAFKENGEPYVCWLCRVKDSGQKLDTLKMSYPLAHPSMLRRHWFRLLETTEGVPERYASGYGKVIDSEQEAQRVLKAANINNIHRVLCFSDIEGHTAEEIAKMLVEGAK